jgi:hypothetical protein
MFCNLSNCPKIQKQAAFGITSKELADGICADYDSDRLLAGLEILDAKLRFAGNDSFQNVELEGMIPVVV